MSTLPPDSVRVFALGGLGEIGMNMLAIEAEGKILLIDAGLMFPEPHMLGIDLVLPDISALAEREADIVGWVLTHGHEDHIGALPYLWCSLDRPPVYGTLLTMALLSAKLDEHGISTSDRLHTLSTETAVTLGPFTVEAYTAAHSIVDGVGLAIHTPAGRIIHTGDFKLDPTPVDGRCTDLTRLRQYGDEGVLLLLADSTNVEHEQRALSETTVGEQLRKILTQCRQRVLVSTFSSNVHRIQQIADAAASVGRAVCVHGRSMENTVAIARRLGYLNLPDTRLVTLKQALALPAEHCLILTTGSQGEPRSALMRIALGEHNQIQLEPGDRVILSSKFIPGNEKAIGNLINHLFRQGAEVDYEKVSEIHVSGHASQAELAELHAAVRPKFFIPIHGEYRHLVRHARLATTWSDTESDVLTNGESVVLTATTMRPGEPVESGRVLVDGKGVGDLGWPELRDRRHIATQGIVTAVMALDKSGALTYGPLVLARGLIGEADDALLEEAADELKQNLNDLPAAVLLDPDERSQTIRTLLRRFFKRRFGRRPLVLPVVMDL